MKKIFFLFLSILSTTVRGQVWDGYQGDSSYITFDTMQIEDIITDTSTIWQIGSTTKPFFSQNLLPVRTIMTDTVNSYPTNANSWFQLTIPAGYTNVIVNFVHKYQTDSLHDGCIVEFSTDTGATWENVKGGCNVDGSGAWNGVLTDNLYGSNDTLVTGEMAFSGNSSGWIHSRVQFFWGFPIKSTDSTDQCNMSEQIIHLRFRFLSDNIADTLDGWIIDSVKIEYDGYSGIKNIIKKNKLSIHPNPSEDGRFYFPELNGTYKTEIFNSFGQTIYNREYHRNIDMSSYAKGLYFYKVSGESELYTGQLIIK